MKMGWLRNICLIKTSHSLALTTQTPADVTHSTDLCALFESIS